MTLAAGREWGAELEEDVFDESCAHGAAPGLVPHPPSLSPAHPPLAGPLTDLLLLDELLDPHAAGAGPAGGGAAAGAGAGGVGGGAAGPFGALPPGGDASTLFTFPPGFGGEAVATGHVIPDTDPAYGLLMGGGRVGGEGDAAAAAAAAPAGAAGGGGGAADDSGCAAAAAATQPEGAKRQRGGTRSTSLMRGVTHHWRAGRGTDYL